MGYIALKQRELSERKRKKRHVKEQEDPEKCP